MTALVLYAAVKSWLAKIFSKHKRTAPQMPNRSTIGENKKKTSVTFEEPSDNTSGHNQRSKNATPGVDHLGH
eukprot:5644876-Pyramimonas_sp.AAC.1